MKPLPSCPSRFSAGTSTLSKKSSAVSWPFRPIFFSRLPLVKPFIVVSTTTRLVPLAPFAGSVFATTITRSAFQPLVMKVFEPLTTYLSPLRIALVFTDCRSEPVPGSVIAIAPISSPVAIFGRYFFLSTSLP